MSGRYVYMKVTRDKYKLPVAISDTVAGLSKATGISEKCIKNKIYESKKGKETTYIRVWVEDEDED